MNVIFGEENANAAKERFTILELDTFDYDSAADPVTAYCVIGAGQTTLDKIPRLGEMGELHEQLMKNYKAQNWDLCQQLLEHLMPYWGDEMSEFYNILLRRINTNIDHPVADDWSSMVRPRSRNTT